MAKHKILRLILPTFKELWRYYYMLKDIKVNDDKNFYEMMSKMKEFGSGNNKEIQNLVKTRAAL